MLLEQDGDVVFEKVYKTCHDACEGFLKEVNEQ